MPENPGIIFYFETIWIDYKFTFIFSYFAFTNMNTP